MCPTRFPNRSPGEIAPSVSAQRPAPPQGELPTPLARCRPHENEIPCATGFASASSLTKDKQWRSQWHTLQRSMGLVNGRSSTSKVFAANHRPLRHAHHMHTQSRLRQLRQFLLLVTHIHDGPALLHQQSR